ncbi:hypothetical protein RHCRD62_40062 [Rhodococcus sp. RD6.2]|nr:hypothetical protein RHCRD62_40062 [Rhodococcus sp. RD6.2]
MLGTGIEPRHAGNPYLSSGIASCFLRAWSVLPQTRRSSPLRNATPTPSTPQLMTVISPGSPGSELLVE